MLLQKFRVICTTIVTLCTITAIVHAEERISELFRYSGYSKPKYDSIKKISAYAPMSDGAQIALDAYIPDGETGDEVGASAFPVVLVYTPYLRSSIDAETGVVRDALSDGSRSLETVRHLTSHGYVCVIGDTRGNGASSGWAPTFGFRYQTDAGEVVDWIASQAWCDGNVGMIGGSHVGWTQVAAASCKPNALKAIIPSVIPFDGFTGQFYPGGIFMQGFLTGAGVPRRKSSEESAARYEPTPVIDEDGDGELHDEIPLDLNSSGTFLDDYDQNDPAKWPPKYLDGEPREHIYYSARFERTQHDDSWLFRSSRIDLASPTGETGKDVCANLAPQIADTEVAIYNVGGWFDGFTRGTTKWYASLQNTNPSKMLIFPGFHGVHRGFFYEQYGVEFPDFSAERHRFFDRYLKGIENGIDTDPPIHIYNMHGDGWRAEYEWPLARQVETTFFLNSENRLSIERGAGGFDIYEADFTHDRRIVPSGDIVSRWLGLGGRSSDEEPDMSLQDTKALTYTSDVLPEDVEVTGHPIVTLWVSSSEKYGDFYVFLEDVQEDGRPIQVTEGQLRAGWAEVHDNDTEVNNAEGFEVLPNLPWHGYKDSQWQEAILADDNVVELTFDLMPTSWVFKKGHQIRVAVACSNWPDFRLHPELSPSNRPDADDNKVPRIKVHRDGARMSKIVLPIIPREE